MLLASIFLLMPYHNIFCPERQVFSKKKPLKKYSGFRKLNCVFFESVKQKRLHEKTEVLGGHARCRT